VAASDSNIVSPRTPRWLHYWAVLTVVAALPLLTLGAEVTTKQVGMVDQAPIRWPWHLVSAIQEKGGVTHVLQNEFGWLIEHSHRTFGWLVGVLVIGLAIGLWKCQNRRWLRWAGVFAVLGVTSQGILGILRVDLNQRIDPSAGSTLALIHGCTAQLVFALLVGVALWTSPAWERLGQLQSADLQQLRRPALLLVAIMFLQITFGAMMRHKGLVLGTRMHVLLAFAVVAVAVWLGVRVLHAQTANPAATRAIWILWSLIGLQLFLGFETMLAKFEVRWLYTGARIETSSDWVQLIPSVHFLVGALTFSTASSIVFMAHRRLVWSARPEVVPQRQLEGVL